MKILVKAPKCRTGELKNHRSVIGERSVEWVDGVAEVEEETWVLLQGIPGYSLDNDMPEPIIDEPDKTKDETIETKDEHGHIEPDKIEKSETGKEYPVKTDVKDSEEIKQSVEDKQVEAKRLSALEYPTMENTVKEIEEFASKCIPPIDLKKERTKKEMLARIPVLKFPDMENTTKEIKSFASKCVPPVDLIKARTKSQMLDRIKKHFA